MPVHFVLPEGECQQLALDLYETRRFEYYGGIYSKFLRETDQAPTALHGWGNQLHGCPCECRKFPMTESRLQSRGLFGALLMTGGSFSHTQDNLPCSRHIHPVELATISGIRADRNWGDHMRLALASLGQMASPIQSSWVVSQLKYHQDEFLGMPTMTPEETLWFHLQGGFDDVRKLQPQVAEHPKFRAYVQQVHDTLHPSVDRPITLIRPSDHPGEEHTGEEQSNEQVRTSKAAPSIDDIPSTKWNPGIPAHQVEPPLKKSKTVHPHVMKDDPTKGGLSDQGGVVAFATGVPSQPVSNDHAIVPATDMPCKAGVTTTGNDECELLGFTQDIADVLTRIDPTEDTATKSGPPTPRGTSYGE